MGKDQNRKKQEKTVIKEIKLRQKKENKAKIKHSTS